MFPKKQKLPTYKSAKKKAWDSFSLYIRIRDSVKTTGTTTTLLCFTCEKPYKSQGVGCAQAGHFLPGRHMAVLFDERNCHGQCYNCNVRFKGNSVKYYERMKRDYGQEVIDELEYLDSKEWKFTVPDLINLRSHFEEETAKLLLENSEI